MSQIDKTFTISGMSCGGCVNSLTRVLKTVPGIEPSRSKSARRQLRLDDRQSPSQTVKDCCGTRRLRGDRARRERMPRLTPQATAGRQDLKITLPVEGMTCAACQANVQRALTAAPGVTKAAVNLMMHEATVHYDPAATNPAKLVAAINDTGYVSHLPSSGSAHRRRRCPRADTGARIRRAADQGGRQPGARRRRDDRVDAVDGRRDDHGEPCRRSAHRWTMRVLDPPLRARGAMALPIEPATLLVALLAATIVRDGVGRPPLLRPRLEGPAPSAPPT